MKPNLYCTHAVYTLVSRGFTEQDVWRNALGIYEPLLAFADKLPTLDAPDYLPSGHTTKKIFNDFSFRE